MLGRALVAAPFHALLCISLAHAVSSATTPAASVASQYTLTTSTSFPFPTATLSNKDTVSFVGSEWSINKGKMSFGQDTVVFVDDPFPNSNVPVNPSSQTSPVFKVTYPAGSFNNATGGAQFINQWNTSTTYQTMLLSYELAFDADFLWIKGGKLPGLRGGPSTSGCSGGKESDGKDCFSARLMWRTQGEGEIYAYIPPQSNLCSQANVICNSDFGTSLGRGEFTFPTATWSRVNLLVQLNDPPSTANGFMALYFNEVLAISQSGLQIRTDSDVNIGGMFFSTFFGGSDDTWATPVETHTYFRNFQIWAGATNTSKTAPGGNTKNASVRLKKELEWGWVVLVAVIMFFCGIEMV